MAGRITAGGDGGDAQLMSVTSRERRHSSPSSSSDQLETAPALASEEQAQQKHYTSAEPF